MMKLWSFVKNSVHIQPKSNMYNKTTKILDSKCWRKLWRVQETSPFWPRELEAVLQATKLEFDFDFDFDFDFHQNVFFVFQLFSFFNSFQLLNLTLNQT